MVPMKLDNLDGRGDILLLLLSYLNMEVNKYTMRMISQK